MKILLLVSFVLSSFTIQTQSIAGQSPEIRASQMVNTLKLRLNLNSHQIEKVTKIYINHYKSIDSLKTIILKRGPNPETINSALTRMHVAMQAETEKKVNAVLSNEQKSTFSKYGIPKSTQTVTVPSPRR